MRLPASSGGAAPSRRGSRGATSSGRRGGANTSGGRGEAATSGGRGGASRGRAGRGGRGPGTSSSGTSVSQPPVCADPTDEDYDPQMEDTETDTEADDLWERGPTGLPPVPTREDEKIFLTPLGDTQWGEEKNDSRLPNGILGVLIREAFPGIVRYKGKDEPAWKWQHYNIAEDTSDEGDVRFGTALERVEESFWWWFRCADDKVLQAKRVVRNVVKRLIPQMFYEGRLQSVITYYNRVLRRKIHRVEACNIDLTMAQYMEAIPWWAQKAPRAWELAVELTWCNEDWKVKSRAAKARRAKMRGSHRQGSCSHARYKKKLELKNKRPVSDIEAYALARRGDQEGTFCNPKTADNIEAYKEAVAEMHGLDFDSVNEPLDNVAVYKAGRGKKHGRYLIGDGFISTPSTLSEVQASQDEVHPQRRRRTDFGDTVLQQEIEKRRIIEERLDKTNEIAQRLQDGYSNLAMIIQTHLKIPVPPLVLLTPSGSSHEGASGASNVAHTVNEATTRCREVNPNGDHVSQSTPAAEASN